MTFEGELNIDKILSNAQQLDFFEYKSRVMVHNCNSRMEIMLSVSVVCCNMRVNGVLVVVCILRGETVYVNFLVTVSCSSNISVVYFCN